RRAAPLPAPRLSPVARGLSGGRRRVDHPGVGHGRGRADHASLLDLLLGADHVYDRIDQRQVSKRLWEVAHVTAGAGVDLLGVQAKWARVRQQTLAQIAGALELADLDQR